MDEFWKALISVITGAAIPIVGNFLLERRKQKNDRNKFGFERVFAIGEEFYRYSGFALMIFTSTQKALEGIELFKAPEALKIFTDAEEKMKKLANDFASANITVTAANIFFGVSTVESVTEKAHNYNVLTAKFMEALSQGGNSDELLLSLYKQIKAANELIIVSIKEDRRKVEVRLKEMLEKTGVV